MESQSTDSGLKGEANVSTKKKKKPKKKKVPQEGGCQEKSFAKEKEPLQVGSDEKKETEASRNSSVLSNDEPEKEASEAEQKPAAVVPGSSSSDSSALSGNKEKKRASNDNVVSVPSRSETELVENSAEVSATNSPDVGRKVKKKKKKKNAKKNGLLLSDLAGTGTETANTTSSSKEQQEAAPTSDPNTSGQTTTGNPAADLENFTANTLLDVDGEEEVFTAVKTETASTTNSADLSRKGKKKKKSANDATSIKEQQAAVAAPPSSDQHTSGQTADTALLDADGEEAGFAAVKETASTTSSPDSKRKKKKKKKNAKRIGLLVSDLTGTGTEMADDAISTEEQQEAVAAPSTSDPHTSGQGNPAADLENYTADTALLDADSEEMNILRVFKLMYGTGLVTLRTLFMDIHPKWSNRPCDAAALDKGTMKLKQHELKNFRTGDIRQWDLSLITTVLLYSKVCSREISKKPGFEAALRGLKAHKNGLLSHPADNKMSHTDFEVFWKDISRDLLTIGAEADTIDQILKDDIPQTGKHYRDLFLEDLAMKSAVLDEVRDINCKLDEIKTLIVNPEKDQQPSQSLKDLSGPKWNEWIRFLQSVRDFDYHQNQYVLITDAMSAEDMKHFSSLRSIPWKMVLDFNPSSERKGMYQEFSTKTGKNSLINMITPAEIKRHLTGSLARQIDPNKTQWLFVNGREDDKSANGGPQGLADWEAFSVKQISRFFACCSDPDKFDKHKPIICFILPVRKANIPYLEVTLNRLTENFDSEEFSLSFVGVKHEFTHQLPQKINVQVSDLSPHLLCRGLDDLFNVSSSKDYRLPTSQDELQATLTQNEYLYLKEYLDVLYSGCEQLPPSTGDQEAQQQLQEELNRHRESFLSGNWISFVSLFDNHDARRELGNEVRTYIQRLLDQGPKHSSLVEIRHSPGTGGTTIARRVLWDLHKSYPCAFAKLEDHNYDYDEDFVFINALADRINALQDICHTTPVILLDGKHMRIEVLSNRLARVLNARGQRALLLKCQHGSTARATELTSECSHVIKSFSVNVKLEESLADLNEFQAKYNEFIEDGSCKHTSPELRRVFHFPLMAMLEGFRPKLQQIIYETFDEMSELEKEIAVVVAFLQKYADQATPAPLLYEAFKKYVRRSDMKRGVTYQDISQLFTEKLLNLMVSANPARSRHTYRHDQNIEDIPESYTLQHPIVAELVLKKLYEDQKRDIFAVTRQFLQFPIFGDERFFALMSDVFVRNKCEHRKLTFSVLFEDLKAINPELAAEVFCKAAETTDDAVVFANAARFHAKKTPPSFARANEIIAKAFGAHNAKMKSRTLYDTKGVILNIELRYKANTKKIKSVQQLEKLANEAIVAFKNARNFPPTFPNPLIGEAKVWLICIGWIMKHICQGDSGETLKYISLRAPPFFRTCIGDSFHLLDVVDRIVQSVTSLQDPEETQWQANQVRMSLMKTFNKGQRSPEGRRDAEDVIGACQALCSSENFPRSSQFELKRLQAQYILNCTDRIETIKDEHLDYLRRLLEDIVLGEGYSGMAYHLMKICVLFTGTRYYTLEQGLRVTEKWSAESQHDPMPYFYQMAIYFLQILDGDSLQYTSRFHKALKMCREKSQNNCRSSMTTHFVSKKGQGMSQLMTRSTLMRGEEYLTDNSDTVRKFWMVDSRKKLLECSGRVRMRPKSIRGGRAQPYIELVQGNIELYVGKSADIGQSERDFSPGSMVYFVVSFNLQGPVANGITFKPVSQE